VAASSSPLAPETSSAEDLATAEKYLNGNQGVPQDRGEAVRWLWKAEGKGNLAATLTLADLFLRGDVRLKNCSQARVLLDAAAKKGSKAAGERLRNLQAFGCQ
jgi:TPR repeat protein